MYHREFIIFFSKTKIKEASDTYVHVLFFYLDERQVTRVKETQPFSFQQIISFIIKIAIPRLQQKKLGLYQWA